MSDSLQASYDDEDLEDDEEGDEDEDDDDEGDEDDDDDDDEDAERAAPRRRQVTGDVKKGFKAPPKIPGENPPECKQN